MQAGIKLPDITFHIRVRDESIGGPNPYRSQTVTTDDYFKGKRVILFALPGAFTPTCSDYQLPGFENAAGDFAAEGIEEIYVLSVNDAYVMNKWAAEKKLAHVKVIPDGSGDFTRRMGMLVDKSDSGMGFRSWRYAAVVNDGVVEAWFQEEGIDDKNRKSTYGESAPEKVLAWLRADRAQG